MREGGAASELGQRPLGAETWREGLRNSSCSCFVLGGGPVGEEGRGSFRARPKASRGQDREGLRNSSCSCFVLVGGPVREGGRVASGLGQRPLRAETGREGLGICLTLSFKLRHFSE